jgi:hypothetical protein
MTARRRHSQLSKPQPRRSATARQAFRDAEQKSPHLPWIQGQDDNLPWLISAPGAAAD